jgi:seryl-tRNA synthetase
VADSPIPPAYARQDGDPCPAAVESLEAVLAVADKRKVAKQRAEALRAEKNAASEDMRRLDKQSDAFRDRRDALKVLGEE